MMYTYTHILFEFGWDLNGKSLLMRHMPCQVYYIAYQILNRFMWNDSYQIRMLNIKTTHVLISLECMWKCEMTFFIRFTQTLN